jgi:quercetin dioxygenase-like cupin family protein
LTVIGLNGEIGRLSPAETPAGRRAETLVHTDQLRVVLVTMRAGAKLDSHCAPGPITIHALTGGFTVHVGPDAFRVDPGHLLALDPRVRHDVEAVAAGAFLLTIGWPHLMGGDPAICSSEFLRTA